MEGITFVTYARFTARFVALLVDWALLSAVVVAASFVLGEGPFHGTHAIYGGHMSALNAVAGWFYFALQESSPAGATLGKKAMGLRVVDSRGGRITFARATGRHFAKWLSALPLGLGFLMAAFTEKKQALHDILAGTCVVEASSSGASAEAGPYARWQR
jgi:uncharacterized RDD family membrane protein YckC